MAQPSQEFPPWLMPSAVIITNAAGAPVTTSTTIIYLPLTYFGPSIPLGSLYVFGGSSEPATVVLPSPTPQTITTTAPPITPTTLTTIATPTTSVSISATPTSISTSAPLTSSSIVSATTSSSSVSSSTSLTSSSSLSSGITSSSIISSSIPSSSLPPPSTTTITAPTGPAQVTGLSRGQLVGVIVASILGLIFLFVLALFLFLWCKGRRNRRPTTPLDDDYYFVPPGGRTPGEGSPRHSGEEADPFLQRSRGPGAATAETSAAGAAAAIMAQVQSQAASRPHAAARVPPPLTGTDSSGSTNSHASGFGVLLDRPGIGFMPNMAENRQSGGTQLSPADMERLEHENVLPDEPDQYGEGEYTGAYAYAQDPLLPPPRLVDPASSSTPLLGTMRPPFSSHNSYLSNQSSFQGDPEESATLLTARRVKVEDLGPRSAPQMPEVHGGRSSGGFLGALGLGGLANLGRRSWFKNFDSPRNSVDASPSYSADPLSEKDIETGRSMLLSPDRAADSFGTRPRGVGGVGLTPEGSRPISNTSGRSGASGGTLYHDAETSLPGTPVLAPLPRAVTPAEHQHAMSENAWLSSPLAGPPAYDERPPATSSPSPTRSHGSASFNIPPGADILDMPAPTALNPFSSISSLKEMTTGSSTGIKAPSFPPPGLDTIRPVGWSDTATATDVTASPGSFAMLGGTGMEHQQQHGISIDVLEEAPPDAEQGWRSMASAGFGDAGRRGTFGMFFQSPDYTSEQGSLHSMRSHFSPSMRSTGSAPAASLGSGSSKPSAHSASRSGSSGLSAVHSLSRAGSISSDDQKRRAHGPISPALSAFGLQAQTRASPTGRPGGSQHQYQYQQYSQQEQAIIGSPPSAHMPPNSPTKSSTIRAMGSGSTTLMDTSMGTVRGVPYQAGSTSPLSASFPMNAPWAGGLDSDWQPSA